MPKTTPVPTPTPEPWQYDAIRKFATRWATEVARQYNVPVADVRRVIRAALREPKS